MRDLLCDSPSTGEQIPSLVFGCFSYMGEIDTHHHLWGYRAPGPSSMADRVAGLRGDFLVEALRVAIEEVGVTGRIVVETEGSTEETSWLSQVATTNGVICGAKPSRLKELNEYDATTHFVGQSTIFTLTDDRATGEAYCWRISRTYRGSEARRAPSVAFHRRS
jgi:hypothetical protein